MRLKPRTAASPGKKDTKIKMRKRRKKENKNRSLSA